MIPKVSLALAGVFSLAGILFYVFGESRSTTTPVPVASQVTVDTPVTTVEGPAWPEKTVEPVTLAKPVIPVIRNKAESPEDASAAWTSGDGSPAPAADGGDEQLDSYAEFNAYTEATMEEHMRLMEDYPPLVEENLSDEEVLHEMEQATAALIESGAGYLSGPPPMPDSSGPTGSPGSPGNP
jgi:hypothetical protein